MEPSQLDRAPFADLDKMPPEIHRLLFGALEEMGRHPEIRRVRRVARDALRPRPGQRLLDAGSGTGDVARELAAEVTASGEVIALDFSAMFLASARALDTSGIVTYIQGDVTRLDLPDGAVDGVWCERVLQHLADPDAAIGELVRVTRPGGRVCLIDTDWESLAFDGMPADLTAEVGASVAKVFAGHGVTMGRTLRRRLVVAGLGEIEATPVICFFGDPASAGVVLPMVNPVVPEQAGFVAGELRERWLAAVADAGERGEFLAVLTIWVVAGTV